MCPIAKSVNDRQKQSFKQTPGDNTARRICGDPTGEPVPIVDKDVSGDTLQFATAVTTVISLPTVAGNNKTSVLFRCAPDQAQARRLEYSLDGGSTFGALAPGEAIGWSPKGAVTQVQIRGQGDTSTDYEVIINRVA